jgi:cytochrome c553
MITMKTPRTTFLLALAGQLLLCGLFALLRPTAYAASVPDTMAQRVLACTACHGREGRATSEGYYPRIAGKPAGYLFNQLQNFKDARRQYPAMTRLIEHLPDRYLREIAEHFSALDLPYPVSQNNAVSAAEEQLARRLVTQGDSSRKIPACAACHGQALTGLSPSYPGLLGLPRDYLVAQLGAWQTDQRRAHPPDCMGKIARLLQANEVAALASWLANQTIPKDAKPAIGQGKQFPMECGSAYPRTSGK